jgi:hypothetical protein
MITVSIILQGVFGIFLNSFYLEFRLAIPLTLADPREHSGQRVYFLLSCSFSCLASLAREHMFGIIEETG